MRRPRDTVRVRGALVSITRRGCSAAAGEADRAPPRTGWRARAAPAPQRVGLRRHRRERVAHLRGRRRGRKGVRRHLLRRHLLRRHLLRRHLLHLRLLHPHREGVGHRLLLLRLLRLRQLRRAAIAANGSATAPAPWLGAGENSVSIWWPFACTLCIMLSKVTDPPTDSGPARVGECAGGGHGRGERVLRERVAHRSRRRRRRRDLRLREGRGRHTKLREPLRVGVGDGVPERALALLSFGGLVCGVLGAVPVERHAIRRGRFVAARGRASAPAPGRRFPSNSCAGARWSA